MSELAAWDSFYVIIGSAAGALIGLQFVVMTLLAERPRLEEEAGAAFGTPTIVHFSTVLLLAALVRAPWHGLAYPAALWGLIGFAGLIYMFIIVRHIFRQGAYKPVFEDWLCHVILPLLAYGILALSYFAASRHERAALFAVGAASLILLFDGIHNAWDTTTYHVYTKSKAAGGPSRDPATAGSGQAKKWRTEER